MDRAPPWLQPVSKTTAIVNFMNYLVLLTCNRCNWSWRVSGRVDDVSLAGLPVHCACCSFSTVCIIEAAHLDIAIICSKATGATNNVTANSNNECHQLEELIKMQKATRSIVQSLADIVHISS
jgi:hypothetical protein